MKKPIVIAVDAMGGDNSPKKIIDGIELYCQKNQNIFYKLFGDKNLIEDSLKSLNKALEIYEIYGAKRLAQITTRNLNKSRRQLSSIDLEKTNTISLERGAEMPNIEDVDDSARHLTRPMD